MSLLVVDASVAIKWLVREPDSDAARDLLNETDDYFAPELIFAEIGDTLWKRVRRGEVSSDHAQQLLRDLLHARFDAVPIGELITDAYPLAVRIGQTVYDALYLALAIRLNAVLVTADERLYNAVASVPALSANVRLLRSFSSDE